jgi:tRNA pseudouridine55 synthase
MEGFLNLAKPAGPTSHDMVNLVRRLFRQRRVGHGGTLDPLAQGVLPMAIGRATRLLSFLQHEKKVYRAEIELGVSTTTYDRGGEVTVECAVPSLSRAELEQALYPFRGEIEQVPPAFSAIRLEGRRFYERARAGEQVLPPPRSVQIYRLELLSWEDPRLTLEVACGSGTYIRSLAHDLGQVLGCGAHLVALVRLQVGPFHLTEALNPEDLAAAAQERPREVVLPMDFLLKKYPIVEVSESQLADVLNGRDLSISSEVLSPGSAWARAYDQEERFLAFLRYDADREHWHPARVFPPLK